MAKLIEYDQVETLKDEDIFLIDGERGTKTISAKNLANDIKKVSLDELTEYTDDKFSKLDDAKLDKTGDASNVTSDIQSATIRTNLTTGEKLAVSLGKIKKFFSDLKTVAFTGSYADLTEKPTSMTANGGNADTVNNHTVDTDVPEDAKFTDTTYDAFVKSGTKAKAGLVPSPPITAGTTKYLREDGTWAVPSSSIPDDAVTGIKGNVETEYRTGKVNLTPENIGAATSADLTAHKKIEAITSIGNTHPLGHVMVYDEKEETTGTNQCAVPSLDLFQREINSLNSSLAKCLSVDGQHATYNPVSDLNWFYNGIGLFTAPTLNMPGDGWYLIISSGVPNTVCQRAVNLFGGSAYYRYCASNKWSSWAVDNYLPVSGGTITGNISTNGGATFATDGNVYLNSNGYKDWLTNILNFKLSTSASCNKNWNWVGKGGQPTWLWGGELPNDVYVYNPSNFSVAYARDTAGVIAGAGDVRVGFSGNGVNFRTYNKAGTAAVNGYTNLGSGSYRWKQLFATTATISTSDRNLKKDIHQLTDTHLDFFLKLQPVSFLFKDGESGRTHIGFIAQDVEQAMSECGLTDLDFAGFCKDQKVEVFFEEDENGDKIEKERPILDENGNPEYIYSLRYEEFIALNTYVIQELWKRVDAVEKENAEMRDQIKSIQQDITELKKSRA